MGYQGFFEILMITLIFSKNLGGYKIMKYTVMFRVLGIYIFVSDPPNDFIYKSIL